MLFVRLFACIGFALVSAVTAAFVGVFAGATGTGLALAMAVTAIAGGVVGWHRPGKG